MLRNIEQKIESLFEGVFGRAFRTHVQPVELARKLAKEMDDHRMVSVSRVYAPNEYSVFLSPNDREQFSSYEDSLVNELQEYLGEHAKREAYVLLSSPKIIMNTDEDLEVGEFGIATRMVQPEPGQGPQAEPIPEAHPGATMIYRPQGPATRPPRPKSSASRRRSSPWTRTASNTGSRRTASSSGAPRTATSGSPTPTSPGATPRCARKARPTGSSTSARRTA